MRIKGIANDHQNYYNSLMIVDKWSFSLKRVKKSGKRLNIAR
jgi:hypothetical protein